MTPARLAAFFSNAFRDGVGVYWMLLKITLPLLILIRLLDEYFNIVAHLGDLMAPLMQLVGLPGGTGIVFATALLLQVYAGILVLATLWHELELSTAQLTILLTMLIIAHALPVELRIAQKAGVSPLFILLLRMGSAFALGGILHLIYADTYLQETATVPFVVGTDDSWSAWALNQLLNWALIFLIIQAVLLLVHFMRATHLERLLIRLLLPPLKLFGIGEKMITMVVVGIVLGLSYGAGLLIQESRKANADRRDVFCAVSLLSLCHALIEDTLMMLFIGAHISGVLFARVIFSLLVVLLIHLLLPRTADAH